MREETLEDNTSEVEQSEHDLIPFEESWEEKTLVQQSKLDLLASVALHLNSSTILSSDTNSYISKEPNKENLSPEVTLYPPSEMTYQFQNQSELIQASDTCPLNYAATSTPMPRNSCLCALQTDWRKCHRARCVHKAKKYKYLKKQAKVLSSQVKTLKKEKKELKNVRN